MKKIATIFTGILYFSSQVFSQNVGIGTTTPTEKFSVKANGKGISQESPDGAVKVGFFTDNGSAYLQTHTNHPLRFSTYNGVTQMTLSQNGNFGIGESNPAFLLDVAGRMRLQNQGNNNTAGIWFNNPTNTNTIGFMGVADAATFGLYGNPFGWGLAMNTNTGYIGVKTLAPTNKLQIGSLGSFGFAGNDLAIGNGTNAMVIYQSDASTLIASSTDIVLKPKNNGQGRVGINTNTPRAPLDVASVSSPANPNTYAYYSYLNLNSGDYGVGIAKLTYTVPVVSIIADGRVLATEFDAYSDARIKNIIGKSNTANDLKTIDALQVTDYTMKDKVKYGNQSYKKVIAQEVEKVYPQVVSKHTDFIPNVYQLANKVEKTADGYIISFTAKHHISPSAKKLQLILSEGMEQFDIISIPSVNEVIINATDLKAEKIFVYGEEVTDFRTVDYEGLTTLNISATQEIYRQLQKEKDINKAQEKRIAALEESILLLKNKAGLKRKAD